MKSTIGIIIFVGVALGIGLFLPEKPKQESSSNSTSQPQPITQELSPLNYNEGDTLWIDVRTPGEYQSGHLDKATNVPLDIIQNQIAQLIPNKTTTVALYCRSGNRSGQALKIAQSLGYTNAFNAGAYSDLVNKN